MLWWQTFTFNHISVISRRSILLVEETTDVPQIIEKHYHIKLYRVHLGIHRVHLVSDICSDDFNALLIHELLLHIFFSYFLN